MGKLVLITGGTTGIGFATAQLFQAEGAQVIITGQDKERLDEAAQALGSKVLALRVDIRSLAEIKAAMKQIEAAYGGLDIVFANAGITQAAPLAAVDEAHLTDQLNINFGGAFFTIQQAVPLMKAGGSIVVNTSCLDELGMPGMSIYAASKAALRSLVRTLAAELAPSGIRVNAVSPGPIDTPIYSKLGMTPQALGEMAAGIVGQVPLGRFGKPSEISQAVLFLASDESSFVLGEELAVDGGWSNL